MEIFRDPNFYIAFELSVELRVQPVFAVCRPDLLFRDPKKFILLFIVLQNNSNTCAEAWIHGGGSGVFKIVSGTAVPVPKYIVNLGAICIFMFFFKNSSARTHRRIRKQLVTLRFSTRVQSCPLDGTF